MNRLRWIWNKGRLAGARIDTRSCERSASYGGLQKLVGAVVIML